MKLLLLLLVISWLLTHAFAIVAMCSDYNSEGERFASRGMISSALAAVALLMIIVFMIFITV